MMGWSRDLGICSVDQIDERAMRCTTTVEIDHVTRTFTDRTQLGSEESTLALAVEQAKAGIAALGGTAHVWLGGSSSIGPDGRTTTSISATVSVVR